MRLHLTRGRRATWVAKPNVGRPPPRAGEAARSPAVKSVAL